MAKAAFLAEHPEGLDFDAFHRFTIHHPFHWNLASGPDTSALASRGDSASLRRSPVIGRTVLSSGPSTTMSMHLWLLNPDSKPFRFSG
jgi:hypothetical protein